MKIHFETDYMAGAHPDVMEALAKTNLEKTAGYGDDPYCQEARKLILELCCLGKDEAEVHFFIGGTQTNATVIDGILSNCEGVIAAESAHINVHESGAIEMGGHKVLELPQTAGKISATDLKEYLQLFYADDTWPHMSVPGMVYITHPTEFGALYSLGELESISKVCREYSLPLYLDGARLGYGLMGVGTDVTIQDIARLCDAFYIGGTKCGALFGEALVIRKGLVKRMFPLMKAHGAVLAKGRLLGIQFLALLRGNLYDRICGRAVALAQELRGIMEEKGFKAVTNSPTNQQFFEMPNDVLDRISPEVGFEYWGPRGEVTSTVRFVTSWATTEADVRRLKEILESRRDSSN